MENGTVGAYSAPTAFAALILPPEATLFFNPSSLSTDPRILLRSSSTDRRGSLAAMSPATPATTGVAIDVPDFHSYSLPTHVLRMSTPGAAIATLFAP